MAATCDKCGAADIRRTQPGAIFDDYVCRKCGQTFSRVAPAAKRMAIIGGFTLLTGGLDLGVLGSIAAALIGSDE